MNIGARQEARRVPGKYSTTAPGSPRPSVAADQQGAHWRLPTRAKLDAAAGRFSRSTATTSHTQRRLPNFALAKYQQRHTDAVATVTSTPRLGSIVKAYAFRAITFFYIIISYTRCCRHGRAPPRRAISLFDISSRYWSSMARMSIRQHTR